VDVIPVTALGRLPLPALPVAGWLENDELHEFLRDLYGTYADYADHLFTLGRTEAERAASKWTAFARAAAPAPAAEGHTDMPPEFIHDSGFGLAWRHLVAWQALMGAVLSESAFFSIGHTLETQADLEASFRLVAHLYYKHALQVLRGFVEDLVLPLWFAAKPQDFASWSSGERYHVPPMKTREGSKRKPGMLDSLAHDGYIPKELAARTASLYGDLNGAIHTQERRLIHRGVDRSEYRGEVFKRDDFEEWCLRISEGVTVGARLLSTQEHLWQGLREQHPIICDICHNWSTFTTTRERYSDGRGEIVTFHCGICRNDVIYPAEFAEEHWPPR